MNLHALEPFLLNFSYFFLLFPGWGQRHFNLNCEISRLYLLCKGDQRTREIKAEN
jgi:hypothetical protein